MRRLFFYMLMLFVIPCYAELNDRRTLSLNDAIMLSIRENPNVQQTQLSYVLQKYSLELAQWQFKPHYSFSATRTTTKNFSVTTDNYVTENATGANASVALLAPYGTKATLSPSVDQSDHFHPELTFEVIQPLMRGFGRPIVEAALYNAMDNEKISRLNVEGSLRNTVTAVINAYLDVIAAQNNLEVDKQALKRSEISVQQTKLFIKSGRKAGVELVAVQADVANAQTRIENDKNNLDQMRYGLLTAIGINPNTKVQFTDLNVSALIKKYHIPTLKQSKQLILENDIQYQTDQITFEGTRKRSILEAEDNTRWELNVTGSAHAGGGIGDGPNIGLKSLINGVNQTNTLTLNLTIPIDDKQAKNAVANAKIALREAAIALQQEKWSKETSIINGWNSIFSAERALHYAESAEKLQLQTYEISFQKYSHGLIDSLQLQSTQQQLIESDRALNLAQINYLKALVNLDQMIGRTLQTWKVKVRYGDADF
jgi:outer membrane protein